MDHRWDFISVFANKNLLLVGLQIQSSSEWYASLGLFFGLLVLQMVLKSVILLASTAFVEIFRNTPVLVQIVWFFFAFPIVSPFEINAFTAATLGYTQHNSLFI